MSNRARKIVPGIEEQNSKTGYYGIATRNIVYLCLCASVLTQGSRPHECLAKAPHIIRVRCRRRYFVCDTTLGENTGEASRLAMFAGCFSKRFEITLHAVDHGAHFHETRRIVLDFGSQIRARNLRTRKKTRVGLKVPCPLRQVETRWKKSSCTEKARIFACQIRCLPPG